jgi:triacylglycerol esterase/lipase EstA (alpha/beta hydrolase family)
LQNSNNVNPSSSSSSSYKLPYSLLDANPSLIDEYGNLNDNISLTASLTTYRNGTIADGVSKLVLLVYSNNTLQFSIAGTEADNLTNGTFSCLKESNVNTSKSTIKVLPQSISNGKSVVVAIYTPPDSFNDQYIGSNRTINVNVSDPNNPDASTLLEIPIQLYRPPVVLIHGIWTNSHETWVTLNDFTKKLTDNGFNYNFADYKEHNSETFDPCDKPFGNYGIDSTRNAIHDILEEYHYFSIAASQVDIVAHSMGGLMARGFVQQPDYKGKENYMKGSIHRLITIGTPHCGGDLSKFLYDYRDNWYCFDGIQLTRAWNCKVGPKKLRTIYSDNFKTPIDKGAVEALIPKSVAYSHLYQTNVKSYAIAGDWNPNAKHSHESQQQHYKAVTDNSDFNLNDAFHNDDHDGNDLVVSVKSQLGGLPNQIRQPESNDPPNGSAVYPNTVHASFMILCDKDVFSETKSPYIQEDIIRLLKSSNNNKFANAIGI